MNDDGVAIEDAANKGVENEGVATEMRRKNESGIAIYEGDREDHRLWRWKNTRPWSQIGGMTSARGRVGKRK